MLHSAQDKPARVFEVVNLLRTLPNELQHHTVHDSGQDQLSGSDELLVTSPPTPKTRRKRTQGTDSKRRDSGHDYDFSLPAGARPKK